MMTKKILSATGDYYLGLDIGTDSVGYAVTDTSSEYRLLKRSGEPMWGTTLFEQAALCDERRAFRTDRRRKDRRQQRVRLVRDIFAHEIYKVDKNFYHRIDQSALLRSNNTDPYCLFYDGEFSDVEYHEKYPTVHHLISELMKSDDAHDVRLVYLACAWLVAHRGHFLSEVSVENVAEMFEFTPLYEELLDYCRDRVGEASYIEPWSLPRDRIEEFGAILRQRGVQNRKRLFRELLFDGKRFPVRVEGEDGSFPFSVDALLTLLSGGGVKISELYLNPEYEELGQFSLDASEEEYQAMLASLGDDGELLRKLKALSDQAVLSELCKGKKYISDAKVLVYERHKRDLTELKAFVKANYDRRTYDKIFRDVCENNYVAYSGNVKNAKGDIGEFKKCGNAADLCAFLKKTLSLDKKEYAEKMPSEMLERINNGTFMPKQVNGDNRVLPYQLYYVEMQRILEKARTYLPFLGERDAEGYRADEKLLSVMRYRIPYYVGPLNEHGEHAWLKRRAEGKIYPWNFDEKVDKDASEERFISRMTNTCTYLSGEDVLPKSSLLYQKFAVLNEINNIKLCGAPIDVDLKQKIYTELFCVKKKVTRTSLVNFLLKSGVSRQDIETLSGIDTDIKSSLSSYISFRRLIENGSLSEDDVEAVILRRTYCEDNGRFRKWLDTAHPGLSEDDRRYVSTLRIKDFGRLSRTLLNGTVGVDTENGESDTVIGFMWDRNVGLSELLLSDRFTFSEQIKKANAEYWGEHPLTLDERLDAMYVSNAVKRPVIRTLEIVSDVVKANAGKAPEKIFVEMARGADETQKHKRTVTRKQKLLELYDRIKSEEIPRLRALLESYGDSADNKLQSDRLYLYFIQLGKCMYSGEPIEIGELTAKRYDIDHIYPQSRVDDDSVLNNKVLVLSEINKTKDNNYPIAPEIRKRMSGFWRMLFDNGAITEEKYRRLTRAKALTEEEEWEFVNRQLVETQQSTKVITTLLSERYPGSEIVFVKAKLVSAFRRKFDLLKSRAVNDLHHAKDAYLNIVCGQVYHSVFTKQWFLLNRESKEYTININVLFGRRQVVGGKEIWKGGESIGAVKKTVGKAHCHLTVYSFCRHGGLFDRQPRKKAEGLVPRKKGLATEIYGGYQKPTATFFVMALCEYQKKKDILIIPVELRFARRFTEDEVFAEAYTVSEAEKLLCKKIDRISYPLGNRILKINTVFEADGFRMCLGGKASGGRQIIMKPITPLILSSEWETYVKKLEAFREKRSKNANITYDAEHDVITAEKNGELYRLFAEKLSSKPFVLRPGIDPERIAEKQKEFSTLSVEEQVSVLLNTVSFFGRAATKDAFTGMSGACTLAYKLSNWKGKYKTVRVIDPSPSGIWENRSQNLLELI